MKKWQIYASAGVFLLGLGFTAKRAWKKAKEYCDQAQYQLCVQYYEKALERNPKLELDPVFQQEYKQAKVKLWSVEGWKAWEAGDIKKAKKYFEDILELDPGSLNGKKGLAKCLQKEGERLEKKGYWKGALSRYEKAEELDPGLHLETRISGIKKRIAAAEKLFLQGVSYQKAGKYQTAIRFFEKAEELDPELDTEKHIQQCMEGLRDVMLDRADRLVRLGKLQEAERIYRSVLETGKVPRAVQGLGMVSLGKAEAYASSGSYLDAILELQEAKTCLGKIDRYALDRMNRIKERIRGALARRNENYTLGIRVEKGKPDISARVFSGVLQKKPETVRIVDPKKLKQLLLQQKLILEGIMEGRVGKIRGADYLAILSIDGPEVRTEKWSENRSRSYQCGTERERNPEYDRLRDEIGWLREEVRELEERVRELAPEVGRCRAECERLRRECDDLSWKCIFADQEEKEYVCSVKERVCSEKDRACNEYENLYREYDRTEDELRRKSRELREKQSLFARTPLMIEVPRYCDWTYQVIHFKRTAYLGIGWKLIDAAEGRMIDAGNIEKFREAEDDMIQNANPSAGVFPDPLSLPSPQKLVSEAESVAIDELGESIFGSIRKKLLEKKLSGFENLQGNACKQRLLDILYLDPEIELPSYCGIEEKELKSLRDFLKR